MLAARRQSRTERLKSRSLAALGTTKGFALGTTLSHLLARAAHRAEQAESFAVFDDVVRANRSVGIPHPLLPRLVTFAVREHGVDLPGRIPLVLITLAQSVAITQLELPRATLVPSA